MDEALLSISPVGQGQSVKLFITTLYMVYFVQNLLTYTDKPNVLKCDCINNIDMLI